MATPLERDRQIIASSLDECGLSSLAPKFLELAEGCLRFRTSRAAVPVGGSKMGGDPDLPATFEWPTVDGEPMTFLAQVDLAVAAALMPSPLPSSGLLSFFFDRSEFHMGPSVCRTVWSPHATERRPALGERFEECALTAVLSTSFPEIHPWDAAYDDVIGLAELSASKRQDVLDWRGDLEYHLGVDEQPRHQLLGYPSPARHDPLLARRAGASGGLPDRAAARSYRNLFAIGSDESAGLDWADGGCLWFLVESAALRAHDFSRVDSVVELG